MIGFGNTFKITQKIIKLVSVFMMNIITLRNRSNIFNPYNSMAWLSSKSKITFVYGKKFRIKSTHNHSVYTSTYNDIKGVCQHLRKYMVTQ